MAFLTSMSTSSYSSVIGGKLQLKGRGAKIVDQHQHKIVSSQFKKRKQEEEEQQCEEKKKETSSTNSKNENESESSKMGEKRLKFNKKEEENADLNEARQKQQESQDSTTIPSSSPPFTDTRTKAQRDFDEAQEKKELTLIRSKVHKSHRQQIEEYNAKLADLSEHHDIPKVGPG